MGDLLIVVLDAAPGLGVHAAWGKTPRTCPLATKTCAGRSNSMVSPSITDCPCHILAFPEYTAWPRAVSATRCWAEMCAGSWARLDMLDAEGCKSVVSTWPSARSVLVPESLETPEVP